MSCSRTQHGGGRSRTPDLSLRSPTLYHWATALPHTWRKLGSLATHWAHSEDSDQTGRMPRLIWVFAGHTYHFVGFVVRRLISCTHSGGQRLINVYNYSEKYWTLVQLSQTHCTEQSVVTTTWLVFRSLTRTQNLGLKILTRNFECMNKIDWFCSGLFPQENRKLSK